MTLLLRLRLRDHMLLCPAGSTNMQYKSKARALLFNLRDANNPQLRGRVLAGDLKPDALVQMTSEELASKVSAAWLPYVGMRLSMLQFVPYQMHGDFQGTLPQTF